MITRSADVASWLGRDMNDYEPFAKHLAASEAAGPEIWTAIGDCPRSMSKRRFTAGSLLVPW